MELPLYELFIDLEDESGVDFIALVDDPAIKKNWQAFQNFQDSYSDYPEAAKENAKIALRYAEENGWGDCGTAVGKARANQLANGEAITRETIARMAAFERHRQNSQKELGDGCGRLMWLAWGGDEGVEWAQRKLEQIDRNDVKLAEGVPHYTADGKLYTGPTHKDASGKLMTGATHTEDSEYLYHIQDLPNKIKTEFKFTADKEKRIISGPAMVANLPIYRRRKDGSEYYVMFKAETIKSVVEKFFKNQYSNNFNIMHRKNLLADGVYLIESMIIDSERGIKTPMGFEELSEGSWFISCKVDNDKVWDDYIKTGVFNGFSVEGEFIEKKISHANKQLDEILAILEKVR
jgi:hypothetical protein